MRPNWVEAFYKILYHKFSQCAISMYFTDENKTDFAFITLLLIGVFPQPLFAFLDAIKWRIVRGRGADFKEEKTDFGEHPISF
jgi:hypothetical protein